MKIIEIKIRGKVYPCRSTMGAITRFKKLTGKEVNEITNDSVTDFITFLYCCVASASSADGIEFPYTEEQFADAIDVDKMVSWMDEVKAMAPNYKQ